VAENEPYPSGNPMTAEGRVKYLESLHSPLELVPADQWTDTHVASLAAGGSLLQNDLEARHGAV
jgi:hypothetical protein